MRPNAIAGAPASAGRGYLLCPMKQLKNALTVGLLFLFCVVGMQVSFLLAQAARTVEDLHADSIRVLANANGAVVLVRESAEQQRGYYRDTASAVKATSKAAFIASRNLARFIDHMDKNANVLAINVDSRMEDITRASIQVLGRMDSAATALGTQSNDVGYQATLALGAARGTLENLERLAANPALARSAQNLERSTANLEKTSAASAEAAEHLRDMLSPRRPSFWRRLLGLLLPRPSRSVAK